MRVRGQCILLAKQETTAYWRMHQQKIKHFPPFFGYFLLLSIQLLWIIFS